MCLPECVFPEDIFYGRAPSLNICACSSILHLPPICGQMGSVALRRVLQLDHLDRPRAAVTAAVTAAAAAAAHQHRAEAAVGPPARRRAHGRPS